MLNNYAYQIKHLKCDCNCLLPRMALITLGVQESRMCEVWPSAMAVRTSVTHLRPFTSAPTQLRPFSTSASEEVFVVRTVNCRYDVFPHHGCRKVLKSKKVVTVFTRDSCTGRYCWERVLAMGFLSVCPSVRPSVCLSVTTRWYTKHRWDRHSGSSPYGSLEYLVSCEVIWCQWGHQRGVPPP